MQFVGYTGIFTCTNRSSTLHELRCRFTRSVVDKNIYYALTTHKPPHLPPPPQLKLPTCSVMHINSNVQCPNINQLVCHIGQTRLPVADCITDLVITYNNRLKFSPHVDNVVAKASLILRCFQSRVLLTKAFCVFVRPILEFSSVVWNPLLENIAKVESVQRRFIKRF